MQPNQAAGKTYSTTTQCEATSQSIHQIKAEEGAHVGLVQSQRMRVVSARRLDVLLAALRVLDLKHNTSEALTCESQHKPILTCTSANIHKLSSNTAYNLRQHTE